jgi:hypothetical protein
MSIDSEDSNLQGVKVVLLRLTLIVAKFSSDSASASPSGSDAILFEYSRYIAASYQASQQSVWRDVCVTVESVRCLEFRNKAVTVTQ